MKPDPPTTAYIFTLLAAEMAREGISKDEVVVGLLLTAAGLIHPKGEAFFAGLAADTYERFLKMAEAARETEGASSERCSTKNCGDRATVIAAWPGQTVVLCRPCAMRARQVADTLGFELVITEMRNPPTAENP